MENNHNTDELILKKLDKLIQLLEKPTQGYGLDNEWLTGKEVCKLLNISKRTLQNYRDEGKIPFYKFERIVYYKVKDIQALLENNFCAVFTSQGY